MQLLRETWDISHYTEVVNLFKIDKWAVGTGRFAIGLASRRKVNRNWAAKRINVLVPISVRNL